MTDGNSMMLERSELISISDSVMEFTAEYVHQNKAAPEPSIFAVTARNTVVSDAPFVLALVPVKVNPNLSDDNALKELILDAAEITYNKGMLVACVIFVCPAKLINDERGTEEDVLTLTAYTVDRMQRTASRKYEIDLDGSIGFIGDWEEHEVRDGEEHFLQHFFKFYAMREKIKTLNLN